VSASVRILIACSLVACVSAPVETRGIRLFPPSGARHEVAAASAKSASGVVVAAHPLASAAGAAMLAKGGNAIDAAIAASFVISVVRPQSTGLGGGGFLMFHDTSGGKQRVFDFRERAPAKASRGMYLDGSKKYKTINYRGRFVENPAVNGHLSVAVPGLVKGLLEVHKSLGQLELAVVMAPAIEAAEKGFEVYPTLAKEIEHRKKILEIFPASRRVFLPNGQPLRSGERLIQSDLARTLKTIMSEGEQAFYDGVIAEKIVSEMRQGGGVITRADLRAYRMVERIPVTGRYRDFRVVSMPPPSSGGAHIIEMLNMLEPFEISKMEPRGSKYLHLLSEVMRRAFADRAKEMGDADFVDVPLAKLTSKSHARELMKTFNEGRASKSSDFGDMSSPAESPSTTHISVIDRWGNAVSTTQTINYSFGSCVVADGTGIVLNDEMDDFTTMPGAQNVFGLVTGKKNDVEPGKRPLSSMSPTMIFDEDGRLQLVVGSPGGPRIINATLQTIVNALDFKMPLLEAVHATRIHHQWTPDVLSFESNSLDADVKQILTGLGHKLTPIETIGDVQAAQRLSDGSVVGVSDSRGEGKPAVP